jgi:hypothetical protein
MRTVHGRHAKVMRDTRTGTSYHRFMFTPDTVETRTLTLVLPEAEWRALREAEPDSVGWLQARIRERLSPEPAGATTRPVSENWAGDDY